MSDGNRGTVPARSHAAAPGSGPAAARLLRSVLMRSVRCAHCYSSTAEPASWAQKCAGEAAAGLRTSAAETPG